MPLDRLLVETDAPYLAPVPYRGKTNEPAFVVKTLETPRRVKGVSADGDGAPDERQFLQACSRRSKPAGRPMRMVVSLR